MYIGSFVYDATLKMAYFMKESRITELTWDGTEIAPWIYEQHQFEECVADGKDHDKQKQVEYLYQVYRGSTWKPEDGVPQFDMWKEILDNLRNKLFDERKYTPCLKPLLSDQTIQTTLF
jgi:hypothetical protein